jgi:hypothetical protein
MENETKYFKICLTIKKTNFKLFSASHSARLGIVARGSHARCALSSARDRSKRPKAEPRALLSTRSQQATGRPGLFRPSPFAHCSTPPRPGRNLGLGRESQLPLSPAWAESRPKHFWPQILIRRSRFLLAETKPSASEP